MEIMQKTQGRKESILLSKEKGRITVQHRHLQKSRERGMNH